MTVTAKTGSTIKPQILIRLTIVLISDFFNFGKKLLDAYEKSCCPGCRFSWQDHSG
jgi:hypothetical protein